MAQFHVDNDMAGTQQAISAAYITLVEGVITVALRRIRINGIQLGPAGLPASADCDAQARLVRITATGTGTAATPNPSDTADGASVSTWKVNDTVEPTVTATSNLKYFPGNQRSAFSWGTNDKGQMLVGDGVSAHGLSLMAKSAGTYTGKYGGGLDWDE